MDTHYAHIENGEVDYHGVLPEKWGIHANFNKPGGPKKSALLKKLNWFPAETIDPDFDDAISYREGHTTEILSDRVVFTVILKNYTRYQLEKRTYNHWHNEMVRSDRDGMTRDAEEHITSYHGGNPSTATKGPHKKSDKELYDAKVALRATKPPDPISPKPGEPDFEQ